MTTTMLREVAEEADSGASDADRWSIRASIR
jgi:hypothetical protein